MLLPLALLGLLGLFAAASSGKIVRNGVNLQSLKRFTDLQQSLNAKLRQKLRLRSRKFVDPQSSLPSNPALYPNVVMPVELVPAWSRVVESSVGLMAQTMWDKAPPAERVVAEIDEYGTGKNLGWVNGYATLRPIRDAMVFGALTRGTIPEGTEESYQVLCKEQYEAGGLGGGPGTCGEEDIGAATAKDIAAAMGTTAAVIGSIASGTVATSVSGAVASSLIAVGVPSGIATTIGSAAGSAAGLAASAGSVAGVAAVVWPAAAMVAAVAAIMATIWAAIGSAKGHTLQTYIVRGRPATPDVEAAVALRDAGGRLSEALRLITPMDVVIQDAYEMVYPGEAGTVSLPSIQGPEIEEQAALEEWVADFLLHHWGMPWTEPFAGFYRISAAKGIHMQNALHGFEWIGECRENGIEMPPASTEGRRRVLAIFAGLGEKEAEWLAKKPGTRGPQPS